MRISFLLALLTISCHCSSIATNSPQKHLNVAKYKKRNFIIKCCGFASCVLPTFVARKTSTTHSNAQTDLTLATDNVRVIGDTDITDPLEIIDVDNVQSNKNTAASTGKMIATTPAPIFTNNTVGTIANYATTSNIMVPGGTTMLHVTTSTNMPIAVISTVNAATTTIVMAATGTIKLPAVTSSNMPEGTTANVATTTNLMAPTGTTMLPAVTTSNVPNAVDTTANAVTTTIIVATTFTPMPISLASANTPEGTTTKPSTTPATLSLACVQPCPAVCNCSGDALLLDAKGELTSEAMKANFILKCGKEVNTTAFYFSRPNQTDFKKSETACCSICSVPKSTSSMKKRSVLQECIYDFQKAYLEVVNGGLKVVFSVAGFRGDCSFLVGKTFSIKWEPIAFCQNSVRLLGSNNTACSVVNSWQTCGNQIQNQKLPANPYCQIIGSTTCGQSFTYSCLASNNLTTFQSLTQGLLLERVSNWAYFLYRQLANEMNYTEAALYCENRMMYLAYFDTSIEVNAVLPWFKAAATQIFGTNILHAIIGLDDLALDGKFVVTKSGALAPALQWAPGQPDGGVAQACVALNTNDPNVGSVGMVDYPCGWKYLFICKIPAEFVWIV